MMGKIGIIFQNFSSFNEGLIGIMDNVIEPISWDSDLAKEIRNSLRDGTFVFYNGADYQAVEARFDSCQPNVLSYARLQRVYKKSRR